MMELTKEQGEYLRDKLLSSHAKVGKCWLWTGFKDKWGYGRFRCPNPSRMMLAHRTAYTVFIGPIPRGKLVCHSCDVPACINPDHLWLGTDSENLKDCHNKGRRPSRIGKKLSNADVTVIRQALTDGVPPLELARQYGVHNSNIYRLRP